MRALLLQGHDLKSASWLANASLSADGQFSEAWLQELLFEHPDLVPLHAVEPGAGQLVPICREFCLPKQGGNAFVDILGVTAHGRLVLIECKLWRNPQARREVIAQIFEYAALLRGWSYGDLLTRLAPRLKWPGANALFQHVSARCGSVDEARFVDGVARSLARGEFILLVAGDGMRADVQAIAAYLDQQMGLAARLALVEFQVWTDAAGNTTVVPWVPLRTNVLEHRIFVGPDELPISVEADQVAMSDVERVVDPAASSRRERSRAFWERFIAGMQLDHPDQPPPRHGGEGWVRLDLPPPANWLTAFRSSKRMGAFFKLRGRDSEEAANILEAEAQQQTAVMDEEAHLKLEYERTEGNTLSVGVYKDHRELGEDEQLAWLKLAVNAMITSFRLRLSSLQHELRPVQIIP